MSSRFRFWGRVPAQFPLGFASGLPLLLTGSTLTAWLTTSKYSLTEIGLFALVAYPYNFKFLWAPLFDAVAPPWLTRRRGWIALLQLATAAMLALMSMAPGPGASSFLGIPSSPVMAMAVLALAVATLSASLDIVTDAYRADVLHDDERGAGAAAGVAGYRVAMVVAGAGALIAADHIGFAWVYRGFALLLAAAAVVTVFVPHAPQPAERPSAADAIWKPLVEFFARPGAVVILALVALYRVGDAASTHMIVPFLNEGVGFSLTEIGITQKGFGMAASVAGAIVGGVVCDRLGLRRTLLPFAILQAVANIGYLLLPQYPGDSIALAGAVVVDNFCNGLGFAALVVLLLGLCHRDYSAFQYALFTSATTIVGRTLSAASGPVIERIEWTGFFAASIVIAIPGLLLIVWVGRRYPDAFRKRAAPTAEADES